LSIGRPPPPYWGKRPPSPASSRKNHPVGFMKNRIVSYAIRQGAVDKGMKPARVKVYPISLIRFIAASNVVVRHIDGQ